MDPSAAPCLAQQYTARAVRVIDRVRLGVFRLKAYSIAAVGDRASDQLVRAGLAIAEQHLREHPTRHQHHGLGFLGIHDGRGENQVFLDLWINQNELTHDYWTSPKGSPTDLRRPGTDHNSVCVWDLFVQSFEREAWLRHVLANPSGPDPEAYWLDGFEGRV